MLRRHLLPALFVLATATSCSSGGGDQTAKFVGDWTFSSGQLTPTCPLISDVPTFLLAGLNVTLAKVDDATISLGIGPRCTVLFAVSGNDAMARPKQICRLDIGGAVGPQDVTIMSWTFKLSGDRIDSSISGSVLGGLCTAAGPGVLVRGTTDAGAGHDGSGDDAADAGSDAGGDAPSAETD